MWVDLVRLRAAGKKIAAVDLKSAKADRGRLSFGPRPIQAIGVSPQMVETETAAEFRVLQPEGYDLLMTLNEARVTRIGNDSFVIVGKESINHVTGDRQDFAQAWWCRPVVDGLPPRPENIGVS